VPGHPFLREVIAHVLANIDNYNPWRDGTGGRGVYRLCGPIAYTRTIVTMLKHYPHRIVRDCDVGLLYKAVSAPHKAMFKSHYLMRTDSIVYQTGAARVLGWSYSLARKIKRMTNR
jgi:hypothetical protein